MRAHIETDLENIVFERNYVTKIRGPFSRGQAVQFNNISGTGLRVQCNVIENRDGGFLNPDGQKLSPEDKISMYHSNGTAEDPMLIRYNRIRGGGGSMSGGGILVGDTWGAYTTVESNILVNAGQYGIGIAGGHHNRLINNLVYVDQQPWNNVGVSLCDWNSGEYGPCHDLEVRGNRIHYTHRDGFLNTYWYAKNCGVIAGLDELEPDTSLTADIWNDPFPGCK